MDLPGSLFNGPGELQPAIDILVPEHCARKLDEMCQVFNSILSGSQPDAQRLSEGITAIAELMRGDNSDTSSWKGMLHKAALTGGGSLNLTKPGIYQIDLQIDGGGIPYFGSWMSIEQEEHWCAFRLKGDSAERNMIIQQGAREWSVGLGTIPGGIVWAPGPQPFKQPDSKEGQSTMESRGKEGHLEHRCPGCGREIEEESVFCDFCGVKLTVPLPQTPSVETAPPPPPVQPPPPPVDTTARAAATCPACKTPLDPDDRFCVNCGADITKFERKPPVVESPKCAYCGKELRAGDLFCIKCGKPIGTSAPAQKAGTCIFCGNRLKTGDSFCRKCGTRQ